MSPHPPATSLAANRKHEVGAWPASRGKNCYKRFLSGLELTQREAILSKCSECSNGYTDGKVDCGVVICPLHPWMPYRAKV